MLSDASDLSLCDSTLGATIAGNESERRKWSRKTGQGPNTRTARAYAEAILSLHALKTFFASQGATPPDPSPVTKSEGCPSSARDNLVQPSRALQVVKAKVAKTEALDRDTDVILCELQDTYNNIVATTYISLLGQFNRWLIFAFVTGSKWCLFAAKAVILGILALLAARPRYDVVAFFAVCGVSLGTLTPGWQMWQSMDVTSRMFGNYILVGLSATWVWFLYASRPSVHAWSE